MPDLTTFWWIAAGGYVLFLVLTILFFKGADR